MKKTALVLLSAAFSMTAAVPAFAETAVLTASLNGASETAGGDPDGTGEFSAEFDTETGDVCYTLSVSGTGAAMAAHIHEGVAGTDGKPVVTIEVTGKDDDLCIAVEPDTLKPIVATPNAYYVNVHTADYPKGAIRGQLGK